jgi:diguanylate cyclase (GGDEF)-like protein
MGKYDHLPEEERRKLAEALRRAAQSIRTTADSTGQRPTPVSAEDLRDLPAGGPRPGLTVRRRPTYALRLRIDGYAYSEGYEICRLPELLASVLSFLNPTRDRVSRRFLKTLVQDSAERGDPSGYSLSRTLLELARSADTLLKGGSFLRRETDRRYNLGGELKRDLAIWEPEGLKLLLSFQHLPGGVLEALDGLKAASGTGRTVDVLELQELVRAVERSSLLAAAPAEAVRETLEGIGALIKAQYRRIFTSAEDLARIGLRVDRLVEEFLACWARLKWFAHELYPALLKMVRVYRREEELPAILPQVLRFVDLDPREILSLERPVLVPPPPPPQPAAEAPAPEPVNLAEEFRGILTILQQAFPGCRLERIAEQDYSVLFWFQQRIFSPPAPRGPSYHRRQGFSDLLAAVSHLDPVGAVLVLHEIVGQMLDSLNAEAVGRLVDPLAHGGAPVPQRLLDLRAQWALLREVLLLRYLKELAELERQLSALPPETAGRYLGSPAGRKSVEMVNQLRNHLVRGYGQVALQVDREELFRAQPLYAVTRELCELLSKLVPERRQLGALSPIPLHRLRADDLVQAAPVPLLNQISSWIEAVPASERLLVEPRAEANRLFLEILYGTADLLDFLLNHDSSPLRGLGGRVLVAGEADRAIRAEIERDRTPLRVELRRDFEQIDNLTGLHSKNEYLRLAPILFRQEKMAGRELALLLADLDRFKAVNDSLGHDFGDTLLSLAGRAVLACCREEDPATRFGGDELLVVLRGGAEAGARLAARIRTTFEEFKAGPMASRLGELAQRQADLTGKAAAIGTLSIGVAQGLGRALPRPCPNELSMFRRADRMLYLAKGLGGNRTVVLVDALGLPLTGEEHADFLGPPAELPAGEAPLEPPDPRVFLQRRAAQGLPLTFPGLAYDELVAEG